jgi:hypothetical protein
MMKAIYGGVLCECGNMYGFSGEEALERLVTMMKDKKSEKKKETVIPLPFLGNVNEECCKGIAMNNGLYTQCKNKSEEICSYCNKNAVDGKLPYGTVAERIAAGSEYKDSKGRKPVAYAVVLSKMKISVEDAKAYALRMGIEVPESMFEMPEVAEKPKKVAASGRPKKAGKSVVIDESEDLFAGLVQNSLSESVPVDEDKAQEKQEKAEKLAAEKLAKAEKLAAEKQEKAEKLAAEKLAKAEKLAAEKADKEAKAEKLAAEKEAKKAALEADKLAKKEAQEAEKLAKAEKLAAEKLAKKEAQEKAKLEKASKPKENKSKKAPKTPEVSDSEEEEEEVQVVKFEFGGKKYLKSSKNVLYDAETQDEIGVWNEAKQEIEFAELEEEAEEE